MVAYLRVFFISLTLVLLPVTAMAWNAFGHMVIAYIAYQNLDANAKTEVDKMVGYFHKEYPKIDSLLKMAPWPDALRAQKIETFTHWHYINVPFTRGGVDSETTLDTDNAIWALNKIDTILAYKKGNHYERARFLAFFVHIVGDLHQPLHTVAYFGKNYPQGDQGGNLYPVYFQGKLIKLHQLWDNGIDYFISNPTTENTIIVGNELMALYPKSYFGQAVENLDPFTWTDEGLKAAEKIVYTSPENQPISEIYIQEARTFVKQQAALAGYRLANSINHILR